MPSWRRWPALWLWIWLLGFFGLAAWGCRPEPNALPLEPATRAPTTAQPVPTRAATRATPSPQPTASAPTAAPGPASPTAPSWWRPAPGLTWQWQLTGPLELDLPVAVYDLDAEEVPAEVVARLHARGVRVICYISVGSYEAWRADADRFPPEVLGKPYAGWPDERWLDIRRRDILAPILRARLDRCAAKGFDAVEPDNIALYTEDTGFPITREDNLRYARWLAQEAHARGLAIGLKNGPTLVPDLVDIYDFAITEEAFYYDFAQAFTPFVARGKAVFNAEYTDTGVDWPRACQRSRALGFSTILKRRELDAWVEFCP